MTVSSDATINGNLFVSGADKIIIFRTLQAPPCNKLELGGIVNVGQYLNSAGGATLGATTFTSTVDGLTQPMLGLASVDNANDAISL